MKILLIALFVTTAAQAEMFKLNGDVMDFKNHEGLLVRNCEKDCLALKTVAAHKKIKLKEARAKEPFLGSVGSDVCRLVYDAGSVIGIAENRDQRAFCVFKDNSLIEINSLTQYLKDKQYLLTE
jgi:hypothetical protein